MSDTGKKETLSLGGSGRRLELRKGGEAGSVSARTGKGGSRKTVQVEVRRKRAPARPAHAKPEAEQAEQAPAAAPAAPPAAEPSKPAPEPAAEKPREREKDKEKDKTRLDPRTRHVLRTLSDEEKAARARALGNARAADEAARQRAEENARRRQEEESRLQAEREAAERRRLEEEERKKTEDEARRRAEEEAERKLHEREAQPGEAAPHRPAREAEEAQEVEVARRRRVGTVEKPRPAPRSRTEPRRRANRLTVSEALTDEAQRERVRSLASFRRQRERQRQQQRGQGEPAAKVVRDVVVPETITVQELANRMAERSVDVIKTLMKLGIMATVNQTIDADTAELVVGEFGHNLKRVAAADVEIGLKGEEDRPEELQPRPPVVTVMGHVDHGKTSLLDAIRQTDVVSGEAGGITQHIGAYQVKTPSGPITFIDTPGHEAFTAMRARGAKVTDIVILVVAADDGVMPQTVEAINHARAGGVPMIVAINKMDVPGANANRVKQELLQHEVVPEDMGGDVQCVEVSALKRQGLDSLEELVTLQAEILELKANPERSAEGVIVEAKLDKGRGPVATVLVQRGTLKVGDIFVAGGEWGRVRAMIDSRGETLETAGPSMPVEVLGANGTPAAGDDFIVVESEARAREVASYRQELERERRAVVGQRGSLEQMFSQIQAGERQELPLIVKADVQGSLEAIIAAAEKLGTDEVTARVLHAGVGGITESDIELARASNALIIGFNVRANAQARDAAKQHGLDIRYYSIIYELVDDLKQLMGGLLAPEMRETSIGQAEVREVFSITKVGKVAGCLVTDGVVRRNCRARLLRDDVVIHDGPLSSLKRFKDDVSEVRAGQECGLSLANTQDIQVGDRLEFYEVEQVERTL